MSNFPTSIDDNTTLPNPTSNSFTNNPDHATMHSTENDAIKAVETKIGTGASTSGTSTVLRSSVAGSSVWGKLVLTSDVTGTLPAANGGTGITSLGTGIATLLGTPSSANLAAALTDETGTGAAVFANTPTLTTPIIGDATGTSLTLGGVAVPTISSTSTLSGKSMSGSSNTFTNIPYSGIAATAWSTWTPTFTNWNIGTGGSAGTVARYIQIGKFVSFYLNSTLGTTGESVTGGISFTLPVAGNTNANFLVLGISSMKSAGLLYYGAASLGASSSACVMQVYLVSSTRVQAQAISSTVPATWTAGDTITVALSYEAA